MELRDTVVLITGASEGIGAALARAFASEGARVVLAARTPEKLNALAAEWGADRALAVPTDVADAPQAERLITRTLVRFGRLDVLVNNAGLGLYARVEETDWEHLRRLWEVNFFAALRLTQLALPHLKKVGGAVVNISSVAGKIPLPYMSAYCATKFALNALGDALRMELAGAGVRVLTVCPGRVATEFHRSALRDSENLPRVFRGRTEKSGVSAERVASVTIRALKGNRREIVVPWRLRVAMAVRAMSPALVDAFLRRAVAQETANW
jgi:short-subunit dehydrogenase